MPGGKGVTGNRTANIVLADPARYYAREIMACQKQIADLRKSGIGSAPHWGS
jgi:hypothetical protein